MARTNSRRACEGSDCNAESEITQDSTSSLMAASAQVDVPDAQDDYLNLKSEVEQRRWFLTDGEDVAPDAAQSSRPAGPGLPPRLAAVFGLDMVVGVHVAPFCSDRDICRFATACPEMAKMLLSDAVWQVRVSSSHSMVLQDLPGDWQPALHHCLKLHTRLIAISKMDHPVLKKPKGAIAGWEVHESRDWQQAAQRWLLLRQRQAAAVHLGLPEIKEKLRKPLFAELDALETELHALTLLARNPISKSPPNRAELDRRDALLLQQAFTEAPPAVLRVMEQKVHRRQQKREELNEILRENLAHVGTERVGVRGLRYYG